VNGVRALRVLAIAAVAVALTTILPASASASGTSAPGAAPEPDAGVELVSQDAWTPIGGDLHLRVRVPAALATPEATLSLVAYQPLSNRAAFDRVLPDDTPGSVLDQVVVPIATLPAGPSDTRTVAVGIEASGAPRDPDRLSLRRTGVYPLAVEVLDANERSQGRFVGSPGRGRCRPARRRSPTARPIQT
jgi:hypothetical protein